MGFEDLTTARVIIALLVFVIPLMVFFARLSIHYGRFFGRFPNQSKAYQTAFAKKNSAAVSGKTEIIYDPIKQISFLKKQKKLAPNDKELNNIFNALILDLSLTVFWMAGTALVFALLLAYQFYRQLF
jgi:hypothetical protein